MESPGAHPDGRARRPWTLTPFESSRRLTWAAVQRELRALGVEAMVVALLLVSARSTGIQTLPPPDLAAQFLAPLRQPVPRPVQEQLTWVGLDGVGAPLSVMAVAPPAPRGPDRGAPQTPAPDSVSSPPAEPEPERAFSEIEVDSVAAIDPEGGGPVYPQELIDQGIEGTVLLRFVVDTVGRVDLVTVRVIREAHPGFETAVREALPRMRYRAAQLNGQKVRQLVEQPFTFRIR